MEPAIRRPAPLRFFLGASVILKRSTLEGGENLRRHGEQWYTAGGMHAPEASSSTAALPASSSEAAIFKRLHPATYLRRFLAEGIRPDGRACDEFRSIAVNAGGPACCLAMSQSSIQCTGSVTTADGSALVRLGETAVVCGLRVEVAEPDVLRPKQGFIGERYAAFLRCVTYLRRSCQYRPNAALLVQV